MPRSAADEVIRLHRDVERALIVRSDLDELLPLLARLARAAEPESDAWIFAHRHLAELAVEHDPWRASLFARRVIALRAEDDGAWAVLGLAQSLLCNYRFAARAYERAIRIAPENPWYAHNLGHLYDVALERPADALALLARATAAQPEEAEIAASYAHALARAGQVPLAKRVLRRAIRRGATADQSALLRWLEAGAPTQRRKELPAPDSDATSGRISRATMDGGADGGAAPTSGVDEGANAPKSRAKRRRPKDGQRIGD